MACMIASVLILAAAAGAGAWLARDWDLSVDVVEPTNRCRGPAIGSDGAAAWELWLAGQDPAGTT